MDAIRKTCFSSLLMGLGGALAICLSGYAAASDDLLEKNPLEITCRDFLKVDFGDESSGVIHHMAPLDRTAVALFVLGYSWGEKGTTETFRVVRYAPELIEMVCRLPENADKTLQNALAANQFQDFVTRLRVD